MNCQNRFCGTLNVVKIVFCFFFDISSGFSLIFKQNKYKIHPFSSSNVLWKYSTVKEYNIPNLLTEINLPVIEKKSGYLTRLFNNPPVTETYIKLPDLFFIPHSNCLKKQ